MLLDTRDQWEWDPPETTVPLPDEDEPTPLDGWRLFEELEELDALDELDELDELESDDEVDEGLSELTLGVPVEGVELDKPGIVAALTALKRPTPATAAKAAPVVRRLRVRIAASLASIFFSVSLLVLSIGCKLARRR